MLPTMGLYDLGFGMVVGLTVLMVWETIWKGVGLWHSAQNKRKGWFIAILIINSMGLLPIIYLIWFKSKRKRK